MQTLFEDIIKIQPKGLLTIPKKMRIKVGMEEDSLVRITEERGRIVIEPVYTLSYPVRRYTKEDIREFIKLDQKESKSLKKKGLLG